MPVLTNSFEPLSSPTHSASVPSLSVQLKIKRACGFTNKSSTTTASSNTSSSARSYMLPPWCANATA